MAHREARAARAGEAHGRRADRTEPRGRSASGPAAWPSGAPRSTSSAVCSSFLRVRWRSRSSRARIGAPGGIVAASPTEERWEVRTVEKVLYDFNADAYLAAIRYVGPTRAQSHTHRPTPSPLRRGGSSPSVALEPRVPVAGRARAAQHLERYAFNAASGTRILGGRVKTGQAWTGQNRPTARTQDQPRASRRSGRRRARRRGAGPSCG